MSILSSLSPLKRLSMNFAHLARFTFVTLTVFIGGCATGMMGLGDINFSHAELTNQLAKRFPVERSVAGLLDVSLTRPRVSTREEAGQPMRLAATFDVAVKMTLSNKVVTGTVAMSGLPRYDAATKSVYLRDARVDSLRAENMPDGLSAALSKAASSIAKDYLEEKPLRTFTDSELSRYGMTFNPQSIEVVREGIRLVTK
jgi:Protein of unknown function (DUF1439)